MTVDVKTAAREWSEARASVAIAMDRLAAAEIKLAAAIEAGVTRPERQERILATILRRATGKLVTAGELAAELNLSERTVYRYMQILKNRGAPVISEPGCGYMIRKRKM